MFCVVCLSAALPSCCGVETGGLVVNPAGAPLPLTSNYWQWGHYVEGVWLCIGKSCRIELFEGVEGDGSVEGWILPSWCSDVVGTGESAGVILQSLHL